MDVSPQFSAALAMHSPRTTLRLVSLDGEARHTGPNAAWDSLNKMKRLAPFGAGRTIRMSKFV
jgi:hypothetical protein